MSAKHTEGPWTALSEYPDWYITAAAHVTPVAKLNTYVSYGERSANARLIAAAPELLEALQLVVDTYGFDSSTDSAIWKTANAALAKARGDQ